ncbi:hypothetical protein ES703_100841 [subsurface metagenome]
MDNFTEVVQELLEACKAQHDAIDRLFAELIQRDKRFFPSKSGRPWEAVVQGNKAVARAEEVFGDLKQDRLIKVNHFECGVLHGLMMQADDKPRRTLDGVYKQLVAIKKKLEEEAGVKKEIIEGGMLRITDKDGNVIIRPPFPYEVEGN